MKVEQKTKPRYSYFDLNAIFDKHEIISTAESYDAVIIQCDLSDNVRVAVSCLNANTFTFTLKINGNAIHSTTLGLDLMSDEYMDSLKFQFFKRIKQEIRGLKQAVKAIEE